MKNMYCSEDFWVSPLNFFHKVRDSFCLPERVLIHDATLRDGEQTPGVVFRKEDKIKIAKMLDEVGVDRIEAGMPVVSEEDFDAIKTIANMGLNAKIVAFCRGNIKDVEAAAACGVWGIGLEVPAGAPRLKWQFSWSEEELLERTIKAICRAKELGLHVTFFPYDTTRADIDFLRRFVSTVVRESKPDSVAVVDTLGCALPHSIEFLVKELKDLVNLPIEVHTHNDFGLAVANELAAVTAGAEVVHVCVNGLGERTGNSPLEETLVSLKLLLGYDMSNIKFSKLKELSRLVEELSNYPVPLHKPIVGRHTFARETGAGIEMLEKTPLAVFPMKPEFGGNSSKVLIGKKSGGNSIKVKLSEWNIQGYNDDQVDEIVKRVKELSSIKKGLVSDEELKEIVRTVIDYC